MSKQEFCVNSVVAKLLTDYVTPTNYDALKEEIQQHTYGNFQWKLVKDITCQETDPRFSNVKRVIFINEQSVILQDVEMAVYCTRFGTYKVMLKDWEKVFISWADTRTDEWDYCWMEGARMYEADL